MGERRSVGSPERRSAGGSWRSQLQGDAGTRALLTAGLELCEEEPGHRRSERGVLQWLLHGEQCGNGHGVLTGLHAHEVRRELPGAGHLQRRDDRPAAGLLEVSGQHHLAVS